MTTTPKWPKTVLDLKDVMAAAERLRRLNTGESTLRIYVPLQDGDSYNEYTSYCVDSMIRDDKHTLADFALSVLPHGERPVAMEVPDAATFKADECGRPGWICSGGDTEMIGCVCTLCLNMNNSTEAFETEEQAKLAREHDSLSRHLAVMEGNR